MTNETLSTCDVCGTPTCLMTKTKNDPPEFQACDVCGKAVCPDCIDNTKLIDSLEVGWICIECGKKQELENASKVLPYDILIKMDYCELKEAEKVLKTALELTQEVIKEYERKPEHDEEVGLWSEAHYLHMVEMAERNYETEW